MPSKSSVDQLEGNGQDVEAQGQPTVPETEREQHGCGKEPGLEDLPIFSCWGLLSGPAKVQDIGKLRENWNFMLKNANKCVDEEAQEQYLYLIPQMMQRCEEAGVSIKQGKKVLGRLQKVGRARAELVEATSEEFLDIQRISAALKDAKQVKNMIDPKLWARAEALMNDSHEKSIQEQKAVISSLVQLNMDPTNDQLRNTRSDSQLQLYAPYEAINGADGGQHGNDGVNCLSKDIECMVCLSSKRSACIVPCGHICMCYECGVEVQAKRGMCPLCRGGIECLMEIL